MIAAHPISDTLQQQGVVLLPPLYDPETLEQWDQRMCDTLQQNPHQPRQYLSCQELLQLGVLDELFTPAMIAMIDTIMPDACFYHLHAYQTPGRAKKPHIHGDNGLDGWHRDEDCLYAFEPGQTHFFSLFIYLTDVDEINGPFEIAPLRGDQALRPGQGSYKMLGPRGTSFLFDRTFWHRATTNQSQSPRRVLKLSFQHRYLFNDQLALPTFETLRHSPLMANPSLAQWLTPPLRRAAYEPQ